MVFVATGAILLFNARASCGVCQVGKLTVNCLVMDDFMAFSRGITALA